jgi:hypothetical protein
VFQLHDDGSLHLVTLVSGGDFRARSSWISWGVLYVYAGDRGYARNDLGHLRAFVLSNGTLNQIAPEPYPPLTELDLTPVADRMPCGQTPTELDLRLHIDRNLRAWAGKREFAIFVAAPDVPPMFADHDRNGLPSFVLTIGCRGLGDAQWYKKTVVLDHVSGQWRAVALA